MVNFSQSGQVTESLTHALDIIASSVARLRHEKRLETSALDDAYRIINPRGHSDLAESYPDLRFLQAAYAMGGLSLLQAHHLVITEAEEPIWPVIAQLDDAVELKVTRSPEAPADALALALGLNAESQKIKNALTGHASPGLQLATRLMGVDEHAFIQAFDGTPETAIGVINGILAGPTHRVLHLPGPGSTLPSPAGSRDTAWPSMTLMGPIVICAGSTDRLYDMLSPYVRQLQAPLQELAQRELQTEHADGVYDVLPLLFHQNPACYSERKAVDETKGLHAFDNCHWLDLSKIDINAVDQRIRQQIALLKKHHLVIVLTGKDAADLAPVLEQIGAHCQHCLVLGEGLFTGHEAPFFPDALCSANGESVLTIENSFREKGKSSGHFANCGHQIAGLGFTPRSGAQTGNATSYNSGSYDLVHTIQKGQFHGHVPMDLSISMAHLKPGDSPGASALVVRWLDNLASKLSS